MMSIKLSRIMDTWKQPMIIGEQLNKNKNEFPLKWSSYREDVIVHFKKHEQLEFKRTSNTEFSN